MIDESGTVTDDPLDEVRKRLMRLYINGDVSPARIGAFVRKIEAEHHAALGDLAEFWLLLSVGEVLAHPTETYGHDAGRYRQMARKCSDISREAIQTHGALVEDLLPARSAPSNIRAHVAAIWAKRPYDEMAADAAYAS